MEEVLKTVTEAEALAAEKKVAAENKADELIASSQARASSALKKAEEELKSYRETTLRETNIACEREAQQELLLKKEEAKNAADALLKDTSQIVSQIVRRVTDGNRRHA